MSFLIELNESSAGRRTVPFRLFNSDGTSPATGASNATMLGSLNGAAQLSLGSLSAVSANAGLYSFALSQSNVSVLGSWALYTDAVGLNFSQHVATVQVVNNNPFSSQSNVVKVTLTPGDYSGATVGINNASGDVSSRWTVAVGTIKAATYSGVTVGTNNIAAGSYSGVTIQGVSNTSAAKDIISDITGGVWYAGVRSGVTVAVNDIAPATYSGVSVSVRAGGIASSSFQAQAIDAASIATDADAEIADAILGRNVAGGSSTGRTVSEALYAIRNRVAISGSTGTVYQTDDTTSAWTFSVTTVSAVGISDLNPAG